MMSACETVPKRFQRIGKEASAKTRPKRSTSLTYILELQGLLVERAKRKGTKVLELARATTSFVELETLKRKIKLQPDPKAIEVPKPKDKGNGNGNGSSPAGPSFQEAPKSEVGPLGPVTPTVSHPEIPKS